MRSLFIFSILILITVSVSGQSKKAFKYYNQAREKMAIGEVDEAYEKASKALEESPEYIEARMLSAQLLIEQGERQQAIQLYEGGLKYNPPYYFYYIYGTALYEAGEYQKSMDVLNKYKLEPNASSKYLSITEDMLANAAFALQAIKSPKPFAPQNMGAEINTKQLDYFPSISANGKTMVFTHRSLEGNKQDEDFWVSEREADSVSWSKSKALTGYLNTSYNEGAQSISANGKIIFFASCDRPEGKGSCDIFASFYKGNGIWGAPINLGDSINTRFWESQPSISSDGKTLYFVRGGSSIAKNIDIYTSTLKSDGRWSLARPIEGPINTPVQESSPFIHYDDEHLYFSSNGHPGMGDQDFFVSKRLPDGSWGAPKNLGYPINTSGEEFGLIVDPNGRTAYYSSDKGDINYGLVDLYTFQLPLDARSEAIAYIEGTVTDIKTTAPLEAEINFVQLDSSVKKYSDKSNRVGYYSSVLPANVDYALSIQKPGYLFYSKNFSLTTTAKERVFTLNVKLTPIEVGGKIKLENVFFATNSYQLDDRSTTELNTVVDFLQKNPEVAILVEGHTDNEGNPAYNKTLSENRAKAVLKYITAKGIALARVTAKGFGDTLPVAPNTTEEGRSLNRRTEIKVLRN